MSLKKKKNTDTKRIYPAQFEVCGVLEQAKLISVGRSQSRVFLRAGGSGEKGGLEGAGGRFWGGWKCHVS